MKAMAKQYHPVDPEKIDYQQFLELAKSGNLYFVKYPKKIPVYTTEPVSQLLEYVARISPYASSNFAPWIADLWNDIVWNPRIFPLFFIRKGKDAGEINRYRVLAYVNFLLNKGVYDQRRSLTFLHLQLEGIERTNQYYSAYSNYAPDKSEQTRLEQLYETYKTKK